MIIGAHPRRHVLAVTFRKTQKNKQRAIAFSSGLIAKARLREFAFAAVAFDGDELRIKPMKEGAFRGEQIHRLAKDGKRERACVWTRQEYLPEKEFRSGAYPARLERGWIVVSMPGSEKKTRRLLTETK
jgi:hypothetical protein